MKTKLSALALLAMTSAAPGFAGSMSEPEATPVPAAPAPVTDWSGSYWGVTLGYGTGSYDQGVSSLSQGGPTVDVDGVMVGLRYGRNYQNGNQVFGFDMDLSTGIDGTAPVGTSGTDWMCGSGECNVDIKALLTARGRFGMTVGGGDTLVYGAAGLAAAKYEGGIFNSVQQGGSETAFGFTVGAGVEHMIRPNMSVFGEANYVDLGTLKFGTNGGTERYDGVGDFVTARFGVNIKF
jgi:outer membrane immunogenic protein